MFIGGLQQTHILFYFFLVRVEAIDLLTDLLTPASIHNSTNLTTVLCPPWLNVTLALYIYPNRQRQAGPTGAGWCPTIHEPKASWHEFLILLMNAHNLLMLFQRKSLPPCPEATASLSSLTVV